MPVHKTKAWKDLAGSQISEDSLWEMTKNYTSYLTNNHDLTLSTDPLNLTGLNTKRDSGVAAVHAFGIACSAKERTVKEKKVKKKAQVVRLTLNIKTKRQLPKAKLVELKAKPTSNNLVYSQHAEISVRAAIKSVQRDLKTYRHDLVHIALKKLYLLRKYKLNNKFANKKEAKTIKA